METEMTLISIRVLIQASDAEFQTSLIDVGQILQSALVFEDNQFFKKQRSNFGKQVSMYLQSQTDQVFFYKS